MTPDPYAPTQDRPGTPTADPPQPPTDDSTRTAPGGPVPAEAGLPVLAGYEVQGELGRGGMGVVYRAHDRRLNRTVAIKMVLGGHVAGPGALVRFLAEAEALAALDHPNVVHVFDRGECGGLPYIVMEFCPGRSLGARVREQPLPAGDAAELVERLARGVAAAHARNILHRDLKPENVLFTADGTPKITDFGLAKRLDDSGEPGTGLTRTGAVMGSPSYMAPEQARGDSKRVGPAADVYGLGAILYRAVAGRPPFLGANGPDTVRQVIEDEPVAPSRLVHGLPNDLSTICLKCLRKDPGRRYASAVELADDLQRFRDGRPIQARPVGSAERAGKWVRRNPAVAGAAVTVAAALLVGALVSYAKYREAKAQEARATQKAEEATAALKDRDAALTMADTRALELQYQLGTSNMVLAGAAYENGDAALAAHRLGEVPANQRGWEWHHLRRLVRGGIFTLAGHAGRVNRVAFSPDGRWVATASTDRTARVWNARTGASVGVLRGHVGAVYGVAFSPDGWWVATASDDRTVRVWDVRSAVVRAELRGHVGWVAGMAFNPDGTQLAAASPDRSGWVWDVRTGAMRTEPLGGEWRLQPVVAGVAFSPDGARVATANGDRVAGVWDGRGDLVAELHGHTGGVYGVSFSPDGGRVVTASDDRTARVWDARSKAPLAVLRGHWDWVNEAVFSPDGLRVATAGADQTVRVWDARSGAVLAVLRGHTGPVTGVAFSPCGLRVATASEDRTVRVWDARAGAPVVELRGHAGPVTGAAVSPDGRRVATASEDQTARLWDVRTGALDFELAGHEGRLTAVAVSPDGARVATTGADQTARVWDARTGAAIAVLRGHGDTVNAVAFSPDGARVATAGADGTVQVWDWVAGEYRMDTFLGHTGAVNGVAFSPDGARLATASDDRVARVWDARSGRLVAEMIGHGGPVARVAFHPDGSRLVTAGADRTARVWDTHSGAQIAELRGHADWIMAVVFSPDGGRVVTAGADQTARVWDARTGAPLYELRGHAGPLTDLAFNPDGDWLMTASRDGTVRIWSARPATEQPAGRTERGAPTWDAAELDYRLIHTRPNARRYRDGLVAADKADDPFATRFYLDRLLALPPERTADHFRAREVIAGDPRLTARAAFHHPDLTTTDFDRTVVQVLAVVGDRLSCRLVAQERLREGKPELAVPLLAVCLATRPPRAPPVEELLLARAYLDLNQPEQARRLFRAAARWLDRPRDPMRAANVITHAVNPINAVGEMFKPIDDPRHNPFDWESWHECDVFRIDVEQRLGDGR